MNPRTRRALEFVLDNLVWFMLLFVLIVFSLFVPNYFQPGIFANIIEASSVLGVMSIGLALVIIAGHMDLSVESVAALSAMAVGVVFCSAGIGLNVQLQPDWLAVPVSLVLALVVGSAIGAINGFLIVKVKMNAFIVTLASFIWVRGIVLAVSGGRSTIAWRTRAACSGSTPSPVSPTTTAAPDVTPRQRASGTRSRSRSVSTTTVWWGRVARVRATCGGHRWRSTPSSSPA